MVSHIIIVKSEPVSVEGEKLWGDSQGSAQDDFEIKHYQIRFSGI